MRKISLAFLISVIAMPAMADNMIKFKADAIEETINNRLPASHRVAVANEYEKQMDQTTGKISVMGIYKVCAAGGMDINTTDGYTQCRAFINEIAEKSGFGSGSATQANCATKMNGVWTLSADGKMYQCVGRDGQKLVYLKSCDGADGECVKQFAGLKTQGPVGREFIMAWAEERNLPLTCYGEYRTRRTLTSPLGQDYIMCSAGGKSYEFEFDSLNQDPGKKSVDSENKAMCEMFGGKMVKTGDEDFWQSCEVSSDVCKEKIHYLALHIGHNAWYQGDCRMSTEVESISVAELKQIDGVNSRIFYKIKMRSDQAKVQLEQYLRTKFPTEGHIECDTNITKYSKGLYTDHILTCTVGRRKVDFLFKDLTVNSKYKADAGAASMACTISGGRYAGKHCRGLTKAECTMADAKIPGGTRWDKGAGACVLKDAARAQRIDNAITIATGVVITVGTLGTMGVVGVVAVSAEVAASVAIDLAFIGLERLEETNPHHAALAFMKDATNCSDKSCAMNIVTNHFVKIEDIAADLNNDELATVASRMDEIVSMLSDDEFDFAIGLTKKDHRNEASIGLLAVGMFVNPSRGAQRLITKAPKLAKQIGRVAAHADDIARVARNADDVFDAVRHLSSSEIALRAKVSQNFDQHLANFLYNGKNVSFDANKISRTELEKLNQYIGDYGAKLQYSASDNRYFFTKFNDPISKNWVTSREQMDHLGYLRGLAKNGDNVVRAGSSNADKIAAVAKQFDKNIVLRRGTENSLGHDYYRIMINDGDDYKTIVNSMQNKGFYVSSNMTDGKRFIAVSDNDIFSAWTNNPNNWLVNGTLSPGRAVNGTKFNGDDISSPGRAVNGKSGSSSGANSAIFSKVYNDMPDEVMMQKLNYVYTHSGTQAEAIQALNAVGAFDESRATQLANDLATEITRRLSQRSDLTNGLRNWNTLNQSQRKKLVSELHEVVTTTRRNHVGNTVLSFEMPKDNWLGYQQNPYGRSAREFGYNLDVDDAESVFNTIVHENVHTMQNLDKSSIAKPFYEWAKKNYTNNGSALYWDNIVEIESRYIGERVADKVFRSVRIK